MGRRGGPQGRALAEAHSKGPVPSTSLNASPGSGPGTDFEASPACWLRITHTNGAWTVQAMTTLPWIVPLSLAVTVVGTRPSLAICEGLPSVSGWPAGFPKATEHRHHGCPTPMEDDTKMPSFDDLCMVPEIVFDLEEEIVDPVSTPLHLSGGRTPTSGHHPP